MSEDILRDMAMGTIKPVELPKKIEVIKRDDVDYDQFYNEETKTFGPLLDATMYRDVIPPKVEGGTAVDYRILVGLKK